MKRWSISKVGDDELFLVKNMFYLKKSTENKLELVIDATTQVVYYNNYGSVVNYFSFVSATDKLNLFYIYKRSFYNMVPNHYTHSINIHQMEIHHSCYKELVNWLKPKIELDIIL